MAIIGTRKVRGDTYRVKFAKYNDIESVKNLVSDKTCAIILETVQGEGGIHPATKEFLEGIKKLYSVTVVKYHLIPVICL